MKARTRLALGVGAFAAFLWCMVGGIMCRLHGAPEAAAVLGLASLPWLGLALWSDHR
ncbi:MAG TPA: hypothetical protein VMR79_03385 [Verrucomicrobiae bacterium]|nr:hypothetical protein [Verrucomicrobiae bacterium]